MRLRELVPKIKPGTILKIKGHRYVVKQHIVWMQHRAGSSYDKWVLVDEQGDDGHRLFIDVNEPTVGLATIFRHDFKEPLPQQLLFEGRKYTRVWDEFCTVVKVEGEGPYKEGAGEVWWDYGLESNKAEGLSLGRSWET